MTGVIKVLSSILCDLPKNLDEICIDFEAELPEFIDPEFASLEGTYGKDWVKLDEVLMNRCAQGMLKRLRFRCTQRDNTYIINASLWGTGAKGRTILGRIESLLPRSMAEPNSFIEIDFDTTFFEPGF